MCWIGRTYNRWAGTEISKYGNCSVKEINEWILRNTFFWNRKGKKHLRTKYSLICVWYVWIECSIGLVEELVIWLVYLVKALLVVWLVLFCPHVCWNNVDWIKVKLNLFIDFCKKWLLQFYRHRLLQFCKHRLLQF